MKNIIIVGSSGHAKVIMDIIEKENKYKLIGLLDRFRKEGESTLGYKILGIEEELPRLIDEYNIAGVIIGIGDNSVRSKVAMNIRELCPDLPFLSTVHPNATIATDVSIGEGTVIMAGACINSSCEIGEFCIINTNASLDHDSKMGDYASLAPGVTTGGKCRIGNLSAITLGVTVLDRVTIGENTVVGSGALVLKDLPGNVLAYGNPAKVIKEREFGEKYLKSNQSS